MSIFLRGIIIQDPIPIMVACHQCKNDSRIRLLNFEEVLQFCLTRTLSVIIVLPKIIAEHLFPPDGDKAESELVTSMQNFDLSRNEGEILVDFDEPEFNEQESGE